jgi:hypothetical protein
VCEMLSSLTPKLSARSASDLLRSRVRRLHKQASSDPEHGGHAQGGYACSVACSPADVACCG